MADGSITFSTELDNAQLEKDLERLRKKVLRLEENLREAGFRKSKLAEQSAKMSVNLDAAKAKLYEMENAAQGVFSKKQIEEQKNLVAALQIEWDKIENEIDKCNKTIRDGNIELEYTKQRYVEMADISQSLGSSKDLNELYAKDDEISKKLNEFYENRDLLAERFEEYSKLVNELAEVRSKILDINKAVRLTSEITDKCTKSASKGLNIMWLSLLLSQIFLGISGVWQTCLNE